MKGSFRDRGHDQPRESMVFAVIRGNETTKTESSTIVNLGPNRGRSFDVHGEEDVLMSISVGIVIRRDGKTEPLERHEGTRKLKVSKEELRCLWTRWKRWFDVCVFDVQQVVDQDFNLQIRGIHLCQGEWIRRQGRIPNLEETIRGSSSAKVSTIR